MDRETRNRIQRATQAARELLENEYAEQLEGVFDIRLDGTIAAEPGEHLDVKQGVLRRKLVTAVEHQRTSGMSKADAVASYLREAAFTTLNRFVALKMLEARELVQECISQGEQSAGFKEFTGLAPGLVQLPDHGYRVYVESLFDEIGREVRVLFDRRDPAHLLWPRRQALLDLLAVLNSSDLFAVWTEDETVGWVYQYFNGDEERKQMRAESQSPRNSRELAVRNQFFTPRYVVRFLTENTLGRIWCEMRRGETNLANLEFLAVQGREQSPRNAGRAKKDPRDLRVLDPACGSGHFLLYAFDLLFDMYQEAWTSDDWPAWSQTGTTLREDYAAITDLRVALPGLILRHNVYGVDIDTRCVQIASLALWMRAQRAYNALGVGRSDRPAIVKTNIVPAEPMPGDVALRREFVDGIDGDLRRLVAAVFERMQLAGEAGTLLRIEDDLRQVVETSSGSDGELFRDIDMSRWDKAEGAVLDALRSYADAASSATAYERTLFADDAARGLGFIDLCRQKYDVVLMNPPFGSFADGARQWAAQTWPRTKNDIYATFVERGVELLVDGGILGAITPRTGFFLSRFEAWRNQVVLGLCKPTTMADLGLGVMDAAMVEAAAYCLEKGACTEESIFFRALEARGDKEPALRAAMQRRLEDHGRLWYVANPTSFAKVPGSPFAYWVSDQLRALYTECEPLEAHGRVARRGVNTNDDYRFLRLDWECHGDAWVSHVKGGPWAPYYSDPNMKLKWGRDGGELRADRVTTRVYKSAIVPSEELYFRPALTWSRRTKSALSVRALPAGCVFGDKGPAIVIDGDNERELLSLMAVANSAAFACLVEFQLAAGEPTGRGGAARSYEVGVLQRTPVPQLTDELREQLGEASEKIWRIKHALDNRVETSHAFILPSLLMAVKSGLADNHASLVARAAAWTSYVRDCQDEIASAQRLVDEKCWEAYGLREQDRPKAALLTS